MKTKILACLLFLSFLANIAGFIFFLSFLNLRGHYKGLRKESNQLARNLTLMRGKELAGEGMDASGKILRRDFRSQYDGMEDSFALMAPDASPLPISNMTLVIYLHGMGSSYMEPFLFPQGKSLAQAIVERDPQIVFASLSYRGKASWASQAAVSDISQNIRELCQEFPVKKIILMGTSMGGCTVLTYAAIAPKDIKDKLAGIVSVESAGDMQALYNETGHPVVKAAMQEAFSGTPEENPRAYDERSLLKNLHALPGNIHISIISARQDRIVPPDLQKETVLALRAHHVPVELVEIDAEHGCPPAAVYLKGFDFALSH